VQRHRARAVGGDEIARGIIGFVHRVRFRRHREVDRRFRQRELAFRAAEPFVGLARVERHAQRARIGEADVLDRHAHEAPADVERVRAPVEHAHHPVERGVSVGAAHCLVKRRDLVVELLAALVEAPQIFRQRLLEERGVDPLGPGVQQDLDRVQQPPRVAVRKADQPGFCIVLEGNRSPRNKSLDPGLGVQERKP
jgi:hypothetical protein